jgi:hypothetical protein
MTPEDIKTLIETSACDAKEDVNLQQLLSATSKSINYLNQGYASDLKSRDEQSPSPNDASRVTRDSPNMQSDISWLNDHKFMSNDAQTQNPMQLASLNKIAANLDSHKLAKGVPDQVNIGSKGSGISEAAKYTRDQMGLEWRRMPDLLVQESKRQKKEQEKERELKLQHTVSRGVTNQMVYHNEAISNIESQMGEMWRRNTAPVNEQQNQLSLNGSNGTGIVHNQGEEHGNNGYNGHQSNYNNSVYENEPPVGYHNGQTNHAQAVPNSELFMISKKSKPLTEDMYTGNFDFDDPNFMDFKKKGKKRGRKSKKVPLEEF